MGSRQSPGSEVSVSPQFPSARLLQNVRASDQGIVGPVTPPTVSAQSPFCSQISPVRLSVTVPSPLSVNLGLGGVTPFWYSPSWPVPAHGITAPVSS